MLRCTFLGTGSALNTVRRHNTSLFLQKGADSLLVDCNGACVQRLAAIGFPLEELRHIFLTHRHIDHIGALGVLMQQLWLKACHYAPEGEKRSAPLHIHANAETVETVRRLFDALGVVDHHPGLFPVEFHVLPESGGEIAAGAMTVRYFPVRHAVPCFGLKVAQGGRSLVYSGDTEPLDSLYAELRAGDVLIHECNSIDAPHNPGHTTWAELEARRPGWPALSLYLVHLPPLDEARDDAFAAQLRAQYGDTVVAARDLMQVEVAPLREAA